MITDYKLAIVVRHIRHNLITSLYVYDLKALCFHL